jgi:hypothetical protein
MEATRSSETSVHTRSTRRHIPEDGILLAFSSPQILLFSVLVTTLALNTGIFKYQASVSSLILILRTRRRWVVTLPPQAVLVSIGRYSGKRNPCKKSNYFGVVLYFFCLWPVPVQNWRNYESYTRLAGIVVRRTVPPQGLYGHTTEPTQNVARVQLETTKSVPLLDCTDSLVVVIEIL